MRVYLDSSALVKRAFEEPESSLLRDTVRRHFSKGDLVVSSALAAVEVSRVVRHRLEAQSPAELVELVDLAVSGVTLAALTSQVTGVARRLGPASLRTLDALHLATASVLAVDLVIAYDHRLLIAAAELGFRTASPGSNSQFES